jgi:hypothetical protein
LRVCVSISAGISWASRFCGPRSNATLDDLGISIALFKDAALALFLWPYLCADRA